jgi:sucrose-6-phosphate hydrolase SacC (GH32 family)
MPFNQSMTVPLELKLAPTPDGPRLAFRPVRELEALRTRSHRFDGTALAPGGANPLAGVQAELLELRAAFAPDDASEVTFTVRGATISYHAKNQELTVNGHRALAPQRQGKQRLTIFCDRTGLEVFASDGLCYVPMPFQPKADDRSLLAEARGGAVKFDSLQVHELKPAWHPGM